MKNTVTIVIVNLNGSMVIDACLKSLTKMIYKKWNLIIVDNGSTTAEITKLKYLLKKHVPNAKLILSKNNVGFASGNNLAIPYLTGDYVLLLNNDTTVSSDLLTKLVSVLQKDDTIGAIQPKIKLMDNPNYLDNAGAFLNTLGFTEHWGFGDKDSAEFNLEREIFSAKGACMMTRKKLIDEIGLFDDHFGSYFEESDFCYRVWMAGYRVIYSPETYILHKVGYTSKKMDQVEVMLKSTRNRIFSLFKNFSTIHVVVILFPHIILLCFLGLYYLAKLQTKKAHMIYAAIAWNLSRVSILLSERRKTQALRKVPDSAFFSVIMHPVNLRKLFQHFKKVEANLNKL